MRSARGQRHLRPLGHRTVRQDPIHLGWWFGAILLAGIALIVAWSVMQLHAGSDVIGIVSVGVSAAATYVVAMLAAVSLINFISWMRRTDYLWILPSDFADFRWDWWVVAAVVVGVLLGRLFWH